MDSSSTEYATQRLPVPDVPISDDLSASHHQESDQSNNNDTMDLTPEVNLALPNELPQRGSPSATVPLSALQATRVITEDANRLDADYVIFSELGRGGMGIVKLARQCSLDRLVAMKILRPEKLNHSGARDRFFLEAMVMSSLDHPSVPPVIDMGIDKEGLPFYCMKRVTGLAWSDTIHTNSQRENLEVLSRICDVVSYAHSQHIIHRDIKPANVMLGDFGEIYLMDWGLAVEAGNTGRAAKLTELNAIAGSPSYLPPESAKGDVSQISQLSDVYLLGAALFEICVGKAPHKGRNFNACVENAKHNVIRSHRQHGPLIDIAMKAMSTHPKERYHSAQDFKKALQAFQEQGQSDHLTNRASTFLSDAIKSGSYEMFAKSCFAFEEALDRWDGNTRAQQGLVQAKVFYAFAAVDNDDLDLAQSIIINNHPQFKEVEIRYQAARQQHIEQEQAARQLAVVKADVERERIRNWITIFQAHFHGQHDAGQQHEWLFSGGESIVSNHILRRVGGKPQVSTLNMSLIGDIRVRAQVRTVSPLQRGFSLTILGKNHEAEHLDLHSGYRATVALHNAPMLKLQRDGVTVVEAPLSDWDEQAWHTISIAIQGTMCHVQWNEQTTISWHDDHPLASNDRNRCGFVSWSPIFEIADFQVDRLGYPLKASILDLAEEHLRQGHFDTASDLFEDALLSQAARSHIGRIEAGRRLAHAQKSLHDQLPAIQHMLQTTCPDARVETRGDQLSIDLKQTPIEDLQILEGLPVCELSWSVGSSLNDLSPLQQLPLTSLTLRRCHLTDYDFLAGLAIKSLILPIVAFNTLTI